jgi:predicted nucleic acid-binding protein
VRAGYVDTSVIVSLLLPQDSGHDAAQGVVEQASLDHIVLLTGWFTRIEAAAALGRVWRGQGWRKDRVARQIRGLNALFDSGGEVVELVPEPERLNMYEAIRQKALAVATLHGLRGADALHVANACVIMDLVLPDLLDEWDGHLEFITGDQTQSAAAVTEGLSEWVTR